MTTGSRTTPHLSIKGINTFGNIRRASCNFALDSVSSDDVTLLDPTSTSDESACLLEWNKASGTENAKFGSWDRFRLVWNGD